MKTNTDIHAAAAALGRMGGSSTSPAKQAASRANGARGGRPRKAAVEARLDALWDAGRKGGGVEYEAALDAALKTYDCIWTSEGRVRKHKLCRKRSWDVC